MLLLGKTLLKNKRNVISAFVLVGIVSVVGMWQMVYGGKVWTSEPINTGKTTQPTPTQKPSPTPTPDPEDSPYFDKETRVITSPVLRRVVSGDKKYRYSFKIPLGWKLDRLVADEEYNEFRVTFLCI